MKPAERAPRVLHVSQPVTAGVSVAVTGYTRMLAERGWDVVVASPLGGDLPYTAREAGGRWTRWDATRSPGRSAVAEARALSAVVRRERPDVVHLHSSKAGLAGRLLRLDAPTVFTPHAWSWHGAEGVVSRAARSWERLAVGRTDALLLCGDDEAVEGVEAGVEASRSEVLGNVIDPRDLPPADRAAARRALGVAHREPVVVCAARLSHQKGQDVLFDAWARAGRPGVLVLVGALKGAHALVDELPPGTTVVIPASRRDVLLWCAAADVVVAPSRYEGMSLGVLEAAAMGAPVVATDVGGMRQALAGTPASFVRPEDPAALAAALTDAVERRAALAEAAARAAVGLRARLTDEWSAGAHRLDALYRDLTGLAAAAPVEAHHPVAPATTDQLPATAPGSHRGAPLAAPREHDRARPPAARHHPPAVVGNIPVGGSR